MSSRNSPKTHAMAGAFAATVSLCILRVLRSWNQTGQKHAGEPDIAKNILPAHNFILWGLVLATYGDVAQRMTRRILPGASRSIAVSCSVASCLGALGFKIAFVKLDAPELLLGLDGFVLGPTDQSSLTAQARAVFIGIVLLAGFTVASTLIGGSKRKGKTEGNSLHSRDVRTEVLMMVLSVTVASS